MKVEIRSLLDGAKEARGTVVIIDVLRASSTIVTMLNQGADFIIPMEKIEDALEFERKNPEYILASERLFEKGYYDNSPNFFSKMDLKGKKIVLLTKNGTRGIVNAKNADEILIGSFVNVSAIVNYLKKKGGLITLVAIGNYENKSIDDELCAEYIRDKINEKEVNFEEIKEKIMNSEAVRVLTKYKKHDDIEFCLTLNRYDVVPKLIDGKLRIVD